MKLKKFSFLLICFAIFIIPTFSEGIKTFLDEAVFPLANGILPFLGIPPPAGPILMCGCGLMAFFSSKLGSLEPVKAPNKTKTEPPLAKVDLMQLRTAIISEIKNLDQHLVDESQQIIRELTMAIETNGLFEEMRLTLDFFQQVFNYRMRAIINPNVTGFQKQLTIQDMINFGSDFRYKLNGFIDKFIKPNINGMPVLKPAKLFFEHLLDKEEYLASRHDDCNTETIHSKIYKSFVYIIKVLTDAYLMVASAHVVKYQQLLKANEYTESDELRENTLLVIEEYKEDAKLLIETTRKALERAPREIKNCGRFDLKRGFTYEEIPFCHIIPQIRYLESLDFFLYKCRNEHDFYNKDDFDISQCSNLVDDIPFGSQIVIDVERQSEEIGPYAIMTVKTPNDTKEVYGRNHSYADFHYSFLQHPECHTVFCQAYKKNAFGISLQRISALPGNVITGVRFRVEDNIIYIDIQQGKYDDLISVDPETVFWTKTPKSNYVAYFDGKRRAIELGDYELKRNSVLTTIQFQSTSIRKGMIRLLTNGLTPPYMNNTDSVYSEMLDLDMYEISLANADSPLEKPYYSLKNYATRPPIMGKRHFITFQPSDMKKDFGHKTIPLIDIREVVTNPPAPLNGIGLYHESVEGSGGFLALKLITPKLTDLLFDMNKN